MTSCRFLNHIDEYLFNRLSEEDKAAFEEHYFNCVSCFEELKARAEVLSVIRSRGGELFGEPKVAAQPYPRHGKLAFLKPRLRWTVAAVSAAAALIVLAVMVTRAPRKPPTFTLSDADTVRGRTVGLVSPAGDLAAAPEFLEWHPLTEGIEYTATLYNQERLWSASTRESRLRLPEEVRQRLSPGQSYSWQVKAFSPQGALIAISSRWRFKIAAPN